MGCFLGIDLGTSYFKAGLFDDKGRLKGLGRAFVKKETGKGDICELPLPVFRNTLEFCIKEAIKAADIPAGEVLTISYSSQANSFVLLDNNDNELTPLILWPDLRAMESDLPDRFIQNKNEFMNRTGLGEIPGKEFAVAKFKWFQRQKPELWKRVKSILFISDYLTFLLTGQKISDVSTASLTGLLDVEKCEWWGKSLELISLKPDMLSTPVRIGTLAGTLTRSGADLTGLSPGIPCFAGALDHHCAAIGSGLPYNDLISESTGTVLACVSYSDKYNPGSSRYIAPGLTPGHHFQMAFNENGAQSLEWYRNNHAPEYSISQLTELAAQINSGSESLSAKPCVFKYPGLSGFENIKSLHGHGHFVRAIMESTAESLAGLVKSLKGQDSTKGIISTGGGARSRLWTEIKAGRLKTAFYIPECSETACMGAAMIGARGSGSFGDRDELMERWVRFEEVIEWLSG